MHKTIIIIVGLYLIAFIGFMAYTLSSKHQDISDYVSDIPNQIEQTVAETIPNPRLDDIGQKPGGECSMPMGYEPYQNSYEESEELERGGFKIWLSHDFEVKGTLLSKLDHTDLENNDPATIISPVDFVMVWDALDDPNVYNNFSIQQRGRSYSYIYDNLYIPHCAVMRSIGIFHIISDNEEIKREVLSLQKYDRVHLKGKLANIQEINGDLLWVSSKRRDDEGKGSTEVFYVEEVVPLN